MSINSPSGNEKDEFSSYHRNSPSQEILQLYLESAPHDSVPPIHPKLDSFLKNIKEKKMLDIGCGLGSIFVNGLIYYGLKPENLFSLDIDKENFKQDFYPRVHKVVGSAEKLEFEDGFFDLVHSSEMTMDNNQLNYKNVLQEISRVLVKGGIYMAFENFDRILELISNEIKNSEGKTKEYLVSQLKRAEENKKLIEDRTLLESFGLSLEKINYFKSEKIESNQFIMYIFNKL